jgi:translation initiation factor IF-2
VVWEGKIETLKHLKDDINEAKTNTECGIALAGFGEIQVGDLLQSVEYIKTPRKLGSKLSITE